MKNYKETAQRWLTGNFDEKTKEEVRHLMETDPAGLEDAFYRNLEFGTGGLRGIMGAGTNRMNKYTVGMATQGLANYIKEHAEGDKSVCISHDSRNNSRLFAEISAKVLSNNGIKVYLFESLRPTPELSYSIRLKSATAGIMVTASHNPKEYNGYKVFWSDGGQITAPVDKDIVNEVAKIEDPADVAFDPIPGITPAPVETMGADVDECYLRDITSLALSPEAVRKHSDLKIVYTPLHGCGVKLMPEALGRIGFKNIIHVPEQDVSDGNFPTVASPNPEEPAAMAMALAKADETGADLVLATDPDADRLGIAVRDDEGKMVQLTGNQTWSFLTWYVLKRWQELGKLDGKGYCVKTIVTTELIAAICESFGVKCYNVLTGFKYIAEIVKKNEGKGTFICGGEESYGFNLGEFVRDKCAQVAGIMVAECAAWCAEQGMTLYLVVARPNEIPDFADDIIWTTPEEEFRCQPQAADSVAAPSPCAAASFPCRNGAEGEASTIIELHDVSIRYGERTILKPLSWTVHEGEHWALSGRNGSGKSTMLRCIYRTLKPDAGAVYLDGLEVSQMTFKESARKMAVVAQHNYYNFDFSVREVVMMGRSPHKKALERDTAGDYEIVREALDKVGMGTFADRSFSTLSGGEQQRVILARALAQQTPCLILDEPTNHLDITHQLQLMRIVRSLDVTVIAAIHDLNIAAMFCDRIYVLRQGEIIAEGTPRQVLTVQMMREIYEVESEVVDDSEGNLHILFR